MKNLLLCLACAWAACQLGAAPRPEQEARQLAENFLKAQAVPGKRALSGGLALVATSDDLAAGKRAAEGSVPAWYVYNQGAEAYVIVSGDDRMADILGYSTDGAFVAEGMPSNLRAWLENYTILAEAFQAGRVTDFATIQSVPAGYPESVARCSATSATAKMHPTITFVPKWTGSGVSPVAWPRPWLPS